MSNVFTLDSIREETKKKFEPLTLELSDGSKVDLRAVIRLGASDREVVNAALETFNSIDQEAGDEDNLSKIIEALSTIFTKVSDRPAALLAELHEDDKLVHVHLLTDVLLLWAKATQLGEAGNSPA